ncbi:vascular endothelial growth factor receptor kdr-like [Palaemon carinicauda]|uniref:vascular endothelial growth factor receptor kdr-like n=1 Tax=Palaemon carinicauda TaxID=392227 RepID=UPI0035B68E2A
MKELNVHILLFSLAFTVVHSLLDVKPPRLCHDEEVYATGNATLICEGDKNLTWTFKYHNEEIKVEGYINSESNGTYVSKLSLNDQNHQGHYYCHYENESFNDGKASDSTHVYLFHDYEDFAKIESAPDDIEVEGNVGEEVVLDCRPTRPNLTVVVTHGIKQLHANPLEDPKMGFVLHNLTTEDSGEYMCKIEEERKTFKVTVREPPSPPWLNISKNTYPVVGYYLELHCRILDDNYKSQPTFDWIQPMRDNRTSHRTEHHNLNNYPFYTSHLRIENITMDDSGTYSCKARVEGRLPTEKSLNIIVKENMDSFIKILNITQNITCGKGENATWDLEVESFPPMPIYQLSSRFIPEQFENGTKRLTLANVTPSDFGEHRVVIKTRNNSDGIKSVNVSLYLEVESDTELLITGINGITEKNSTTTAICNATGYPLENITWHYQSCPRGECPDSFMTPTDARIAYVVHRENHFSSEYTFVAKELARIQCRSGSTKKTTDIIISEFTMPYSFKLNVSGDIKDLQKNSSYNSIETDPIHLICAASRFYFNELNLTFTLEEQKASFEEDEKIIQADTSTELDLIKTLYIENVNSSHKGNYTCFANAKRGHKSKLLTLDHKVDELIAAYLTGFGNMLKEDYKVSQKIRAAFTFNCSVSGTPVIDIMWTKDDQPLPSDFGEFRKNNQVIIISDFKPKIHSGHYKCEARNRGGSVRGFLTLTEDDSG